MQCTICGINANCKCVFTKQSLLTNKPVCKQCAGTAKLEELSEIKSLRKEQSKSQMNSTPSHVGYKQKTTRPLNSNDNRSTMAVMKRNIRIFRHDGERVQMHNILAGRAAFLICSGPSLNQMNLSMLSQRGIVTMGINNSPAIFKPNYWICGDSPRRFIEQIWKDPSITKFAPHGRKDVLLRVRDTSGNLKNSAFKVHQMPNTYFFNRGDWFEASSFLEDIDFPWGTNPNTPDAYGIRGYRSTMILALKMLWYLGAGTVYLLGCDFKMVEDKQNYAFKQNRTPEDIRLNKEVFNALNRRLKELKPYFSRAGFNVINCTPDSGLENYPYLTYFEAVTKAAAECNEKPIQTEGMYEEAN